MNAFVRAGALSLSQLKIIQEVISLTVFVPFAVFYMRQAWSWNYLWAAFCILGAVFFMFRGPCVPLRKFGDLAVPIGRSEKRKGRA